MAFGYVEEVTIDDSVLTSSTVAEDDYPAWGDSPAADLDTGVRVITPSTHQVWESAIDNNATNPLAPAAGHESDWILVGSTNRWKMLDQSPQSQTMAADTMSVVLTPGDYIDAFALLEVDAATVTIQGVVEVTGEIFSQTYDMISDDGIFDYEAYFFAPVERRSELYVNAAAGLPQGLSEAAWTVTFDSSAGEDVKCGVLRIGREVILGNTQWGGRVGIEDYSLKKVDAFGQATVLERAYNRTGDYTLILRPEQVDACYRRLAGLRAQPVIWVADPDYGAALLYGFVDDFAVEFGGPTVSHATLSVKGLA